MSKIDKTMRAISIRQPYVEEIFRLIKKHEYRSRPTKIRGRVYIYASLTPGDENRFRKLKRQPGDFPTGVLVGTVEIVDCKYLERMGCYGYKLKNPRRLRKPIKPKKHPQPVWFYPF